MQREWSNQRWIVLLPFLTVGLVFAAETVARGAFFTCSIGSCSDSILKNLWSVLKVAPPASLDPSLDAQLRESMALRYDGRMTWYLLSEIYCWVCVVAFATAGALVLPRLQRRRWVAALGLLLLALVVGGFFYSRRDLHMAIFLKLFDHAIRLEMPAIEYLMGGLNALGNAALFLLLLAIGVILWPTPDEKYPRGLWQLSRRMRDLRLVLYVGTLLLMTAMLVKKALYQWGLTYTVQDPPYLDPARGFIANLLTLDGGFYTLVLAAAYIPPVLVLQRRALRLTGLPEDPLERDKQLKDYGLAISLADLLPRGVALLGPLLVGPVGELLTSTLAKLQ